MDAKAMAKSKRSHSQHHNKKYRPNQTSKPPPTSGVKDTKIASEKKQIGEKSNALPGNWDRYDEEHNSDNEQLLGIDSSRYSDVVKPKSKGADFKHLISEAISQSESQLNPSFDSFASLDDFLPDLHRGISSLLSVGGERILSFTRDDNFIVEDKATTNYEAPSFLSLNLHTLAEKLAKVDLSKRLFIEADLLPPDLNAEESKSSSKQESDEMSKTITEPWDETDSNVFFEKSKFPQKHTTFEAATAEPELVVLASSFSKTKLFDSVTSTQKLHDSIDDLQESSNKMYSKGTLLSKEAKSISIDDSIDDLFAETPNSRKPYQASPRREEKGMLPTNDAKSISIDDSIDDLLAETSISMNQYRASQPQAKKGTLPYKDVNSISIHDSIDDLLAETSNSTNQHRASLFQNDKGMLLSKEVKPISINDSIDGIFAETSNSTNQHRASLFQNDKGMLLSKEVKPISINDSIDGIFAETSNSISVPKNIVISSVSGQKSNVLDDFDLWLDTI